MRIYNTFKSRHRAENINCLLLCIAALTLHTSGPKNLLFRNLRVPAAQYVDFITPNTLLIDDLAALNDLQYQIVTNN